MDKRRDLRAGPSMVFNACRRRTNPKVPGETLFGDETWAITDEPKDVDGFLEIANAGMIRTTIKIKQMKISITGFLFIILGVQCSFAQHSSPEQEIMELSKAKWQWMAEKNVDKLASLFHDESKFVHMSGTWKKNEELDIIKTGRIWYKKADVNDIAVEIFDDHAIVWSRLMLTAVVRGSDAITQFTVTEVYKKQGKDWKLLALTFSSVRDTHQIEH